MGRVECWVMGDTACRGGVYSVTRVQADLCKAGTISLRVSCAAHLVQDDLPGTQSKKGISSLELGRRLVSPEAAWMMKHKLAQVMLERNASKRLKGNVQMEDAYIGGAGQTARARRNRQDAVSRCDRDNGRWQDRSNHPSASQSLQQLCDQKARKHRAQARRQYRLRRSGMLRRCHPSRMPAHLNKDRKRQASDSHPCIQMGQYSVGQYQSRPRGDLRACEKNKSLDISRSSNIN